MKRGNWQDMHGVGDYNLEIISRDVIRRNRWNDDSLADMKALAEDLENDASFTVNDVTYVAAAGYLDDLDKLIEKLDENQREEIVRAYMASAAVTTMTGERSGTSFGQGRLARLTVKEEGVVGRKRFSSAPHGVDISRSARELEPGTVIEGRVWEFSSAPAVGGFIQLDHFILNSVVQGLVDPTNGEPRVELDMLVSSR